MATGPTGPIGPNKLGVLPDVSGVPSDSPVPEWEGEKAAAREALADRFMSVLFPKLSATEMVRTGNALFWPHETRDALVQGIRESPFSITLPAELTRKINDEPTELTEPEIGEIVKAIVAQDGVFYPEGNAAPMSVAMCGICYRIGERKFRLDTLFGQVRRTRGMGATDVKALSNGAIVKEWKRELFGIKKAVAPQSAVRRISTLIRYELVLNEFELTLGRLVRNLRIKKGISREALAEAIKPGPNAISPLPLAIILIEKGMVVPSTKIRRLLERALNLPEGELGNFPGAKAVHGLIVPLTLGEYIELARMKKGMSQIKLGQKSGVKQGTISSIGRNKEAPSPDIRRKLERALELPDGELDRVTEPGEILLSTVNRDHFIPIGQIRFSSLSVESRVPKDYCFYSFSHCDGGFVGSARHIVLNPSNPLRPFRFFYHEGFNLFPAESYINEPFHEFYCHLASVSKLLLFVGKASFYQSHEGQIRVVTDIYHGYPRKGDAFTVAEQKQEWTATKGIVKELIAKLFQYLQDFSDDLGLTIVHGTSGSLSTIRGDYSSSRYEEYCYDKDELQPLLRGYHYDSSVDTWTKEYRPRAESEAPLGGGGEDTEDYEPWVDWDVGAGFPRPQSDAIEGAKTAPLQDPLTVSLDEPVEADINDAEEVREWAAESVEADEASEGNEAAPEHLLYGDLDGYSSGLLPSAYSRFTLSPTLAAPAFIPSAAVFARL